MMTERNTVLIAVSVVSVRALSTQNSMLSEEQPAQLVSNCSLAAITEMCLRILQSLFGKRIPSKHIYRLVLKFWTGY